ncbi:Ser/Thr phosphatase family protein, partial [Teladorsagia circumcincta]
MKKNISHRNGKVLCNVDRPQDRIDFRRIREMDIKLNPVGITDHEDEFEEEGDEDSASIDLNDIVHDDLIADLLIRVLNSPLIDDPLWTSNENNKAELPVHIVADLHGNLPQVLRVFKFCGIPQKETFLFLGDYVDRGVQGIEVITLLFCLKIRYPYQVYLLRGNHEDANTTLNYGFFDECITRWPSTEENAPGVKIKRPSVVPAYGIGCDLVWSDPALHRDGWVLSHRGISFLFGPKAVEDFCAKHHLDIILRGHQISNEKKMAKEKKVKKDVDKKSSENEQDILDTADSKPPVKTPKKEPSPKCALRSPKLPETIESGKKSPTVESHSTKAVRKHTPKARTPKEQ